MSSLISPVLYRLSVCLTAMAVLAGTGSSQSAAPPPRVLLTNIPGHPLSFVPGMPSLVFAPILPFLSVQGSARGNWILVANVVGPSGTLDVLLVNGRARLQEGSVAPWSSSGERVTNIGRGSKVSDNGDFAFIANTDGDVNFDESVVRNQGGAWVVIAQEGGRIPGLANILYGGILDSPVLLDDGRVGFRARDIDGVPNPDADTLIQLGNTVLMQTAVTIPGNQAGGAQELLDGLDSSTFRASADGTQWLVRGDTTGSTTRDDVLMVNGQVVLQERESIPGSGSSEVIGTGGLRGQTMDSAGNWMARGAYLTSDDDWVVRNGAVLAEVGAPIASGSAERWSDAREPLCFFALAHSTSGHFIIGGATDAPSPLADEVLVLDGREVIAREGDAVDLDGNGLLDDDAFIATFDAEDPSLADCGTLRFVASLRDSQFQSLGEAVLELRAPVGIGASYCTSAANSTGQASAMVLLGSSSSADNDLRLCTVHLPPESAGFFLASLERGLVVQPGGSIGTLCLGGAVGRFSAPSQVASSGTHGTFQLLIDLGAIPQPTGPLAVTAGSTWRFQAWHRDSLGGSPVSNFSDGMEVTFD